MNAAPLLMTEWAARSQRLSAERDRATVRALVWAYFWLLLIEGALRKWIFPQLSDALLLIRDPVVVAMIAVAVKGRILQTSRMLRSLSALAVLFCFVGLIQVMETDVTLPVMAFGLRTYFLHVPVIFIIGQVFRFEDVRRMGLVLLAISIPMALLMAFQFQSDAASWINIGAGGGQARQIRSALEKIRPAGMFSFISGPILFYEIVLAVVLSSIVHRGYLPNWLCYLASVTWLLAGVVSGSRSFVAGSVTVMAAFLLGTNRRGQFMSKTVQTICIGLIAIAVLAWTDTFSEGVEVLNIRFEEARGVEGTFGANQRVVDVVMSPVNTLFQAPLIGSGIGIGTAAGASLLKGRTQFLLAESEWDRVLLEAGPILGLLYIAFRLWLTLRLGVFSWKAARTGNMLPLLLFGACATTLATGQWGQPTTLGFAVFGSGLCLASAKRPDRPPLRPWRLVLPLRQGRSSELMHLS